MMVASAATTVNAYLEGLPDERRRMLAGLRAKIAKALPKGFVEVMQYGMISWVVPASRFPDTYNKQPLAVVSLASQKQYASIYLLGLYGDPKLRAWFEKAWAKSGKKLNMGKSCLRFRSLEELELPVLLEAVGKVGVEDLIAMHDAAHGKKKAGRAR